MKWRYQAIFGLFVFFFLCIWGKLFYWQIVRADELADLGKSQYSQNLETPPKRGSIMTSDGFPLVTNRLTYLVYANPKVITNKTEFSNALASVLHIDVASVSAQIDLDKLWVPIDANIDYATKAEVEKLNLPGVGFQETPTRFYPEASMAAQLLGFMGKDDVGNDKGYFGLEGYYDRQLKGRIGQTTIIRDAMGRPVLAKLTDNSGQQDGWSLKLHIDRVIQFIIEEKLAEGIKDYGAESGLIGVMDPKTGAILAMATYPSFDPRTFWQYDGSLYKNPFITNTYEPGSTFKPIVMAAAMDAGLVKPTTTCPICSGPVTVGDYDIKTWDNKYFPNTNMIDIIQHSDNTGMVYISKQMGLKRMLSMLKNFGFGQTTGIDLQGELAPYLKNDNEWYPIDVATASFGQGIAVTPIELLDAFATIANNGIRMEPHIVSEIDMSNGDTIPIPPKQLNQPMSSETAKVMTEILVNAVDKGEASFARLKGYRIAGKTGTASIAVNGKYDASKTIASFIGFAPADNPKFVMLVIFNKPTTSIYGAETAAPTFFGVAKDILAHYGIGSTGD